MLDSLGAIKELYEASKGGEVLAAINHAAKMTTSTLPFTGFSRSQIRSIPTRYDVTMWEPNFGFSFTHGATGAGLHRPLASYCELSKGR